MKLFFEYPNCTTCKRAKKFLKENGIEFKEISLKDKTPTKAQIKSVQGSMGLKRLFNTSGKSYRDLNLKENFDNLLNELTIGIKKLDNKNITVEDVTEEFVDGLARLKVKKETEQTYLKILSQAKTVKDILEVQNQIQDLRSDIEAIEGRLRYLQKSVNYSTLNISMYQIINSSIARPSFFTKALNAVKEGIGLFSDIIIGILYLWIFILIIIAVAVIIIKKRRNKIKEKSLDN